MRKFRKLAHHMEYQKRIWTLQKNFVPKQMKYALHQRVFSTKWNLVTEANPKRGSSVLAPSLLQKNLYYGALFFNFLSRKINYVTWIGLKLLKIVVLYKSKQHLSIICDNLKESVERSGMKVLTFNWNCCLQKPSVF